MSRSLDASTPGVDGLLGATGYVCTTRVRPQIEGRDRLSVAFRPILALPHALLVGGPLGISVLTFVNEKDGVGWTAGGGALGAVAATVAFIGWFAILFTGRYPNGLYALAALYLRWRVRAIAYMMLLVDEYPPFGDAPYPAELVLAPPPVARDRVSVGFRVLLALPQLLVVALLGVLWVPMTLVAWVSIVVAGRVPEALYAFSAGMLRWTTRVEGYMLLLYDDYPPFSLD
jgi:hypothetical protein